MDRQGAFILHPLPPSLLTLFRPFTALWRFRRCLRTRDLVRRPSDPDGLHNISQPLALAIRDMLREYPLLTFERREGNDLLADGGDPGARSALAERSRQA